MHTRREKIEAVGRVIDVRPDCCKYYLFIDECGDHNHAKYSLGKKSYRIKLKKSGLLTALSDRAKPIPKIVARASEVFLSRGNYPL